jgi:hypothetical protein
MNAHELSCLIEREAITDTNGIFIAYEPNGLLGQEKHPVIIKHPVLN